MRAMKRTSSIASIALALAAGAMMGGTLPTAAGTHDGATVSTAVATAAKGLPWVERSSPAEKAAWLRMRGWGLARHSYPRPGWSVRYGQRLARKRRNQARHRRACHG